ncbi:transglutaminase family protein [Spirosoma endbachense]|uniref:Transglutaminase n=1 Tax=Spirosoma endbachense TaxID=2666025 RepID=A0A6P1WA69_9BACT|nr:transglutaminase family protein [Spirosoma endbachense]QHW00938.1 transglutaminase [Spirosoma endbachense]
MSIRIAILHQTHYEYDRMVFLSPHLIRLKPAAHCTALIESYSLTIEPANHLIHWQQDPFGNFIARIDFAEAMQTMSMKVDIVAELVPVNPFDFFLDTYAESFPFRYDDQLQKDLAPYLEIAEEETYLKQWIAEQVDQTKQGTIDFLINLNKKVNEKVAYNIRLQPGVQTPEETLVTAIGSCRDSAWLLVQILRQFGLAARFVSGYLAQVFPDEKTSADASEREENSLALHAWAEVYIPGAGWIGLDATSGMLATEGHIPLACTSNPASAAPLTGTTGLSETTLTYTNTLVRLN